MRTTIFVKVVTQTIGILPNDLLTSLWPFNPELVWEASQEMLQPQIGTAQVVACWICQSNSKHAEQSLLSTWCTQMISTFTQDSFLLCLLSGCIKWCLLHLFLLLDIRSPSLLAAPRTIRGQDLYIAVSHLLPVQGIFAFVSCLRIHKEDSSKARGPPIPIGEKANVGFLLRIQVVCMVSEEALDILHACSKWEPPQLHGAGVRIVLVPHNCIAIVLDVHSLLGHAHAIAIAIHHLLIRHGHHGSWRRRPAMGHLWPAHPMRGRHGRHRRWLCRRRRQWRRGRLVLVGTGGTSLGQGQDHLLLGLRASQLDDLWIALQPIAGDINAPGQVGQVGRQLLM
mmetsp:Transcript_53277/g.84964  ORF Transcript_53277/g.84964 Transcript_53277/m.84964 type:complete len:339 (-) Transcript_53277:158-1174(-)